MLWWEHVKDEKRMTINRPQTVQRDHANQMLKLHGILGKAIDMFLVNMQNELCWGSDETYLTPFVDLPALCQDFEWSVRDFSGV